MTIQIYGMAVSSCTSRVLAALYEKQVTDWEFLKVNLMTGEQKKPEFLALQPFGVVPVLKEGPLTIFESRTILRFIAHKFEAQGTPLYGSTPLDKVLVDQWIEVEGQNYAPAVGTILSETVIKKMRGGQPEPALVDASMAKLNATLDIYEAHLAKSKYFAGDFFSLADITNLPNTWKLVTTAKQGELIESRPHVKAWYDDVSARPSWKKVLEEAALEQRVYDMHL